MQKLTNSSTARSRRTKKYKWHAISISDERIGLVTPRRGGKANAGQRQSVPATRGNANVARKGHSRRVYSGRRDHNKKRNGRKNRKTLQSPLLDSWVVIDQNCEPGHSVHHSCNGREVRLPVIQWSFIVWLAWSLACENPLDSLPPPQLYACPQNL